MVGNSAKDKYILPPDDVLEPAHSLSEAGQKQKDIDIQRTLRILEDNHGALYIDPDVQHIDNYQDSTDLLRIYSREIQALRKVVSLLMGITTSLTELLRGTNAKYTLDGNYDKVWKYLENASWELTLINDPENPGPPPG